MLRTLFSTAVISTLTLTANAEVSSLDVAGTWATEAGTAQVTIEDCGDGTPCGVLSWIDMSVAASDKDMNNPDESLRGRDLIGVLMIHSFERRGNEWKSGKIYDPESGKTYGSRIKLNDDGSLRVKGCVGPICQTQTWQPVNETM